MFEGNEDNSAAICPGLELGKVIKGSWRELNSQEKKLKRALVCSTMLLASGWKESRGKQKLLWHFQWKDKPFVLPAGWQRAVSTWWDHQLESREVNGQWQLLEGWMLFCSLRVLYQVDCWQQVSVSLVWIWTRSWLIHWPSLYEPVDSPSQSGWKSVYAVKIFFSCLALITHSW